MTGTRSLAIIAIVVAAAAPARADTNEAQAKVLYDEGKAAFAAQDYPTACRKLEASFQLNPLSGTRGLLAGCYEKVGKLASAWNAYRDSAAIAQRQNNLERAQLALQKAAELEPRLARLTIDASAIAGVGGAEVRLDGVVQPRAALASAIPVDEGPHVIEAHAKDYKPWKQSIEIDDGAKQTVKVPALVEDPALRLEAEERVRARDQRIRTQKWFGYGLMGAGGAAIVTSLTLGTLARMQWSDARDAGCDGDGVCLDPDAAATAEAAASKATAATIVGAVGVALGTAGVIVYFTRPKRISETAPRVTPTVGPDAVGLSLEGRF